MKITIVGNGYVGLSLAILLSQYHEVIALDIDKKKVNSINNRIPPIEDTEIINFFKKEKLNLIATNIPEKAYAKVDFVIICTPTNYDHSTGQFDTSTVKKVIKEAIKYKSNCPIVIKSTVPVGFTNKIRNEFKKNDIIFSPEFLREGNAIFDNLNPSRIIVGDQGDIGKRFSLLLKQIVTKKNSNLDIVFMQSSEAEAVKLFSNTFLAMRIAFFNELDTYCEVNKLNAMDIINGIGKDPRIGNYYNNPSFGYGGYCLPKDSMQLLSNFSEIPNNLIKAIVEANSTRKDFIASQIIDKKVNKVGVFRLVMKEGSDNIRESATLGIIDRITNSNIEIIIYEPTIKEEFFLGFRVVDNLKEFKAYSDLIIANRNSEDLDDIKEKVYTRDLFNNN